MLHSPLAWSWMYQAGVFGGVTPPVFANLVAATVAMRVDTFRLIECKSSVNIPTELIWIVN